MSKLYFRYGTMESSKTAQLLMTRYNYLKQDKDILVFKPTADTREGISQIKSRAFEESVCAVAINKTDSIFTEVAQYIVENKAKVYCILVDESQFLASEQIEDLWKITKTLNIPVICYGLRTDFKSHLFEGSKRLLELADSIEEIKTVCNYCNTKATMNMKVDKDNNPVFEGDSVSIGYGYVPVCGKCYLERKTKNER